ncbi:MAG: hypothetical protein FWD53_10860, partial [Phycisphaerales bacterium]|nr:hypothetical protein [Phycisphaerales bacterium]
AAVQTVVEHNKYWGQLADVMNPQAIAEYIRLTHDRYYARYGHLFGTVIQSIFTDEARFRWSRLVPDRFQHEHGHPIDYTAYLDPDHPDHRKTFTALRQLMHKMFHESYDTQLSDWCRRHNIRYCTEKDSESFDMLACADIPGCDSGHVKAGARPDCLAGTLRHNARATASAAYFYNKEGSLCECGHSLGWSATLQDYKFIAEYLTLQGITHLVPHGFFYSTHALKKHDAPPSFFFQMPWYNFHHLLSERLNNLWQALKDKHSGATILLLDTTEGLPTNDKADSNLQQKIQNALADRRVEFVVGNTEILEAGTIGQGNVRCHDLDIRVVILPLLKTRPPRLESILTKLREAGVHVLEASDEPSADAAIEAAAALTADTTPWRFEVISGQSDKIWLAARTATELSETRPSGSVFASDNVPATRLLS